MPRRKKYDRMAVDALIQRSQGVVRRAELITLGVPASTLTSLTAPGGRWQRILPGVILTHRGAPTLLERRRAALVYAGPGARISGHHALDLWGALRGRVEVGEQILVVIPHSVHRTSSGFCVIERSERPTGDLERSGLPVTTVVRAAADACRRQDLRMDDVRELLSTVLSGERCSLQQLQNEVRKGPTQRTRFTNAALREVGAGARSAAESRTLRLVEASDLPQPVWNTDVSVNGRWVGHADAYWPSLGVVLEIDSMEWHLGATQLRRTQEKARRYAAAGLILISIAPADLAADPAGFLGQLRETLATALSRQGARR